MARTAGRRTCETLASDPGQADQTGSAGGARKPGPGRQIVSQDNASASAESKVRPGPRPLTLRPHHRKTAEAGPEALSTVSLPNTCRRSVRRSRRVRHSEPSVPTAGVPARAVATAIPISKPPAGPRGPDTIGSLADGAYERLNARECPEECGGVQNVARPQRAPGDLELAGQAAQCPGALAVTVWERRAALAEQPRRPVRVEAGELAMSDRLRQRPREGVAGPAPEGFVAFLARGLAAPGVQRQRQDYPLRRAVLDYVTNLPGKAVPAPGVQEHHARAADQVA